MRPLLGLCAAALMSVAFSSAYAADESTIVTTTEATATAIVVDATQPLSLEEMAAAAGGDGVVINSQTRQQLTATATGNTVNAETLNTGNVSFAGGALDGFNGIGNFVVNTGANNTLQGAININIITVPTP